jgi:hypothetical protein
MRTATLGYGAHGSESRPKADEAMQVEIFPKSVLVGREGLAARAQEVLGQNDMGGGRRRPRTSIPTSGAGTAASSP